MIYGILLMKNYFTKKIKNNLFFYKVVNRMDLLQKRYRVLDQLRLPHNLYRASLSNEYNFVWLRDSVYVSLPYLNKKCGTYEQAFYSILNIFKAYEWKLDIHTKQRPNEIWEYMHIRYDTETLSEINTPWSHAQNDVIGIILWGIGEGIKHGKKMIRDEHDLRIIQKLIKYLEVLDYANDSDSGMWEENRECGRSSSVGACLAGLKNIRDTIFSVNVPCEMIKDGYDSLAKRFPNETETREVDAAQLSLIYPYKILTGDDAKIIVDRIEKNLLRNNGVIRYQGDSYFSTLEEQYGRHRELNFYYSSEMQWAMFIPWLALSHMELNNIDKARYYIEMCESLFDENGYLPEGYLANGEANINNPLGWSHAMFILAKEKLEGSK